MKNGIHQVSINQLRSDLMRLEGKTPSKYEKRMPKREILKDRKAIDGRSTSLKRRKKGQQNDAKAKAKHMGIASNARSNSCDNTKIWHKKESMKRRKRSQSKGKTPWELLRMLI
eukprot:468946_1